MTTPVSTALISVADKTGLPPFCRALHDLGIALLSTGGSAALLREHGIPVTEVSEHTGFPEIMDGRVKTLHPTIHGGLLGRPPQDDAVMRRHGIAPIELLVVNLYPFEQTASRPDCDLDEAVENIDIGGPAMLRSAAKNYRHTAALAHAADYPAVLEELRANDRRLSAATRFALAQKAFAHTARYDANIANYLGGHALSGASGTPGGGPDEEPSLFPMFPMTFTSQFSKAAELRYGENPHQAAALYREAVAIDTLGAADAPDGTLAAARQLQGKALSYNNLSDADAALECVLGFDEPACVIVKHANPCGAAAAADILQAYEKAHGTDPTSAFGGVIAFNRALDAATAKLVLARQFVEVILAPAVSKQALQALADKPETRALATGTRDAPLRQLEFKRVSGGVLVQDSDTGMVAAHALRVAGRRRPEDDELRDLLFAWRVAKYVKSNAIVYARARATVGIGAGQMSRVLSVRLAAMKAADAGLKTAGSVMASDAFFPFRDGLDAAAEAGIRAVIQPGGSVKDKEVIAAADEHGMAMVFTGMRHFRH